MEKWELVGCIFCSEKGSGEHINSIVSIKEQVKSYFNSYKAKRANKFIAYFQNFTNTYDSIENLKQKYDSALIDDRIVALAVATRPDCIDENIAKLLKNYSNRYYVWVELGLQTSNDNIDVVTHIMVGLPNETRQDLINTVGFLNDHNIQGLKIHSCYVVKNTVLANMYKSGSYTPIDLEYYLNSVAYILTHINPNIVIHRVSGDAPKDLLLAPSWNLHKKWVINGLDKLLRAQNLYQGMYYK